MRVRFLIPAATELEHATEYYRTADVALAAQFLREIAAALSRIANHPLAWTPVDINIRRCRVRRFPYGLVYSVETDSVVVVSVMHLHRHPDSWRSNLGK